MTYSKRVNILGVGVNATSMDEAVGAQGAGTCWRKGVRECGSRGVYTLTPLLPYRLFYRGRRSRQVLGVRR
jgi:hypothetical protein